MQAARLRDQIALEAKVVTRDAMGGDIITWVNQVVVRAAVLPLRGREFFEENAAHGETEIRFVIRYRDDITSAWRVVWEGRPYDIVQIIDINGRHIEQQLMAKTQING